MKYAWFIRFDCSFENNSGLLDYLRSKCETVLVYEHPAKYGKDGELAKDVHCHGFIRTDITDETIRAQIKKQHDINKVLDKDGKVKSGYCKKPKISVPGLISYMSRGKYEPKLNIGVSDIDIQHGFQNGYDKDDKETEAGADSATKTPQETSEKIPRITMWSIANEAYIQYIAELKDYGWYINGQLAQPWRYKIAYPLVLKLCKSYKKGVDNYVMQVCQLLSTLVDDGESQLKRIESRIA